MIGILNYGIGNPASLVNMLDYLAIDSQLIEHPELVSKFEKIIFPGVGNFNKCSLLIHDLGFDGAIREFALSGKPILGICVGAQMLGCQSEEGSEPGLHLMPVNSKKFPESLKLPVPRMSWGEIEYFPDSKFGKLFTDVPTQKFYFSHSYFLTTEIPNVSAAKTNYGFEYLCVAEKDNLIGVQFHPEKSHKFGMNFLEKFVNWKP